MEQLLKNEADTKAVASALCRRIKPGMTVGLLGELGAGKTTLVRYLAAEMGFEQEVSSPSYVLQNIYLHSDQRVMEHWDLYRLGELPEDLHEPPNPNTIRMIEWADKFSTLRPLLDLLIELKLTRLPEERLLLVKQP